MTSFAETIIPDSVDELIERLEKEDSSQFRLTLLHKTKDSIYCFLSPGLSEVIPEQKIPWGITLAFSKRIDFKTHYDLVFHKQNIDKGYYFLLEDDNPIEAKPRVIPFCYQDDELPSTIVERNLKTRLLECITAEANQRIKTIEQFGELGLIKTFFKNNKENKEEREAIKEEGKAIKRNVQALFHEESSPSVLLHQIDYNDSDKDKKTMFVKSNYLKVILQTPGILSILTLIPQSIVENYNTTTLKKKYKPEFNQSKEEEAKSIISDFYIAHPKAVEGIKVLLRAAKHTGNITTYATIAGVTALSYKYLSPYLSYPLIATTGASGLTMTANIISSRGKNSSGIISTLIDKVYFNRLA